MSEQPGDKVVLIAKTLAYQEARKSKVPHAKAYANTLFEYFISAAQIILQDIEGD